MKTLFSLVVMSAFFGGWAAADEAAAESSNWECTAHAQAGVHTHPEIWGNVKPTVQEAQASAIANCKHQSLGLTCKVDSCWATEDEAN